VLKNYRPNGVGKTRLPIYCGIGMQQEVANAGTRRHAHEVISAAAVVSNLQEIEQRCPLPLKRPSFEPASVWIELSSAAIEANVVLCARPSRVSEDHEHGPGAAPHNIFKRVDPSAEPMRELPAANTSQELLHIVRKESVEFAFASANCFFLPRSETAPVPRFK
jgi:hypothetical protein